MFGGSGSIQDDARNGAYLPQGRQWCKTCKGRGYYYAFKQIKWYGLRRNIPRPEIESFDCAECKGYGSLR